MAGEQPPASGLPSARESLPYVNSLVEKLRKVTGFVLTFRALRKGAALWDFSPEQLRDAHLLSAWEFNLIQSTASASVALGVVQFAGLLFSPAEWNTGLLNALAAGLVIPVSLAANSYAAAYAISDQLAQNYDTTARIARAYLYMDGRFGVVTQTVLTTFIALYVAAGGTSRAVSEHGVLVLAFFMVWVIQIAVSQFVIPGRLLDLAGLAKEAEVGQQHRKIAWWKYQAYTLIAATAFIQGSLFVLEKVKIVQFIAQPVLSVFLPEKQSAAHDQDGRQ